jgi:hypothetical protein
MTNDPALIVEFPTASTLDQNLRRDPPAALGRGEVVLVRLDVDGSGRLGAPPIGEVVLSVPSPETLPREPDELRRVIDGAPRRDEPLIILVEEAESLLARHVRDRPAHVRPGQRPRSMIQSS